MRAEELMTAKVFVVEPDDYVDRVYSRLDKVGDAEESKPRPENKKEWGPD